MNHTSYRAAVKQYIIGAVLASILTLLAYFFVTQRITSSVTLLSALVLVLAVIQLTVQITYFLHFGADKKPRWRSYSLLFTTLMIVVVVVGSIWIMRNLNYRMNMSPDSMNMYMIDQNKKGF